jgi:hypothetical protein
MHTADLCNDATRGSSRFLVTWSLFTSLIYIGLIVAILTLVMPAAKPNPLGDTVFRAHGRRARPDPVPAYDHG